MGCGGCRRFAVAMPFELGFGQVRDRVLVKVLGWFEVAAAAVGALLGTHVVFDEAGVCRRFRSKATGMLPLFLAAAIVGRPLPRCTALALAFAALQELLHLMFQLRNALAQLGVIRLQLRNPLVAWIIHDRRILTKTAESGKRKCLTVTLSRPRN